MELKCSACSAAVATGDIDEARALARCSFCGTLMDLSRRPVPGAGGRAFASVDRPEVPLPPRFQVGKEGTGLRIAWRWFTPAAIFLGVFSLFWCGFLVFWYGMAAAGGAPLVFFLFPLIHVAVGVGIGYVAVAMFVNRTTVTVEKGTVSIRHAPLPWPGNRTLGRADVEQLFCTQKVSHGKNGTTITYQVEAVGKGGRRTTLLKGLEQDQALYVEQRVERQLGIGDRPMAGEVPR